MTYNSPKDMALTDDQILDHLMGSEGKVPDYPSSLMFSLDKATLETIGVAGIKPDDNMRFACMGEVTSIYASREDCRIELEVNEFAGPDGKFQDLERPAHLCLCGPELEKMDLDPDAERGDLIHLIGTARMESMMDSEFGDNACFQITELTFEDESSESRDGG